MKGLKMKKTILLIIALTIVGNANMCNYHMIKLNKSIHKAKNFKDNNMQSYMKLEISTTKYHAINVISECDSQHRKDLAKKSLVFVNGL